MGLSFSSFNPVKIAKKAVKTVVKVVSKAISWIIPTPDIPDFGTGEFDDFETGVLLNKQSNDASIPVIYGERLVGGTRVFLDSGGGSTNQYLYMAIVMCEGEINSIEEIRIDDKVVTWASSLSDGTEVEVSLLAGSDDTAAEFAERFKTSFTQDSYQMADNKFGY